MKKIGINMEQVKVNNSASILRLLNQKGPMSRKDIASELGLTSAAVTILCTDMMDQKVIINKGEVVENRSGRKKVLIDINYQNKQIISVSVQPIHTYLFLCDIKGNPTGNSRIKTNTALEPEAFLDEVAKEAEALLKKANTPWGSVLGMGVTVTGIVDSEQGISKHAYGIWDREISIKEILENRLKTRVTVGNNVKAFAEAELIYGARRTNEHILFVKWGPGVGSSIAIRNNTYEGKDYMAGELGHYVVEPGGKKCRCGRKGCLETLVSYQAILEKIKPDFTLEEMPGIYKALKGDFNLLEKEVLENNRLDILLESQDEKVKEIIKECIQTLAHVVVNAITILAPNQVIILSPFFDKTEYYSYFLLCSRNLDNSIHEQLIMKSKLENAMNYIGGVAIAANQYFFNRGGFSELKEESDYGSFRVITAGDKN